MQKPLVENPLFGPKSLNTVATTLTVIVTVWLILPDVPLTLIVATLGEIVALADRVRTVL
jgi:hypothetical protein